MRRICAARVSSTECEFIMRLTTDGATKGGVSTQTFEGGIAGKVLDL